MHPREELRAGDVGYIISGLKTSADVKVGDTITAQRNPCSEAIAGFEDDKPMVAVATNEAARKAGIKAGDLVRHVSAICGGKGGGKPDSAMGGGTNALKLDDALAAVDDYVAANVKD